MKSTKLAVTLLSATLAAAACSDEDNEREGNFSMRAFDGFRRDAGATSGNDRCVRARDRSAACPAIPP